MLVFWDQRLVLLATPKTGSTAIAAALDSLATVSMQRPQALKHTSFHRFDKFFRPYLAASAGQTFACAALMREPRDRLGSWYRYRQREGVRPERSTVGISFDDFVRAWCSDTPPEFASIGAQSRFLRPRQGKGVDHLFRYERLDAFLAFLEDRLDCEILLPRLNVSPQGATELSAATEALLRKTAAAEFSLYESLLAAEA